MSAHLGRFGGHHDVEVDRHSSTLVGLASTRFDLSVDWPHMWRPGHAVTVRTLDNRTYEGAVLAVSVATKKVLIELV